jgi:signal transduction histidine kinase
MSNVQGADAGAESVARARLRERQLLLAQATDERILDHSNTLAETLQFIVDETRQILNAWHVDILFVYADGLRMEISSDPAEIGRFIPIDQSISGLVLSSHTPVLVNDLPSDPRLSARYYRRVVMGPDDPPPGISVLAAELRLEGQPIGVINVEGNSTGAFNESHLNLVQSVAHLVSMAVTHAALFDEDNFRTATDRLLVEAGTGDSDAVMMQVLEEILSTLNSLAFVKPDAADILFADPQDDDYLVVAYSTNSADIGLRIGIGTSVCGEAFRSGKTVLEQLASKRSDYRPLVPGMKCEMAIPIVFGGSDRFPIGVLNLESSRENAFSNVGQALAERFTRRVVNAIAMSKIRADIDSGMQDQMLVLAADQVLNSVHRINNYVGSVRAVTLDLLADLRAQGTPADLGRRLEMILLDAERALEIPDDMRRLIAMPRVSADVNAQVEAGLAAVRLPKNVNLVRDLAPGLPDIPCTSLDLVVENLAKNALSAMRDQPGTLTVTTRLDRRLPREPFIAVTIADTGTGMTDAERARLFEPRQSGRQGSGLGFGMLWVRSWIRRAQGLIDVDSARGKGTTVRLRFQLHPHVAEQLSAKEERT